MDLTGLGAVADLASGVIHRIWPDASEAEKAKLTLALAEINAQVQLATAQTEVNKTEASSPSLFVAGWRPAIGWVIALVIGYSYLIYPMSLFLVAVLDAPMIPPKLALDENLWQLIIGLLGLSAGRSWEKIKGVAR